MTNDSNYGVMVLKFEFWLSVILFVGGGFLIFSDHSLVSQVFLLWGVLITFWFSRRSAETSQNNIMSAMQQQVPSQIPQIPQIPQEPQIKITEQPAQPNAPAQQMGDKANV